MIFFIYYKINATFLYMRHKVFDFISFRRFISVSIICFISLLFCMWVLLGCSQSSETSPKNIHYNTIIMNTIDARFYDENLFEKYILQPQKDYEDTIIIFRRIINKDFVTDNDTLFLFEKQDSLYKLVYTTKLNIDMDNGVSYFDMVYYNEEIFAGCKKNIVVETTINFAESITNLHVLGQNENGEWNYIGDIQCNSHIEHYKIIDEEHWKSLDIALKKVPGISSRFMNTDKFEQYKINMFDRESENATFYVFRKYTDKEIARETDSMFIFEKYGDKYKQTFTSQINIAVDGPQFIAFYYSSSRIIGYDCTLVAYSQSHPLRSYFHIYGKESKGEWKYIGAICQPWETNV